MAISRKSDESWGSGLWDTIKTLIYAVLIAMVFRTVLVEPFNIPSGSMVPTLLIGDYLFVTKYSYGYSRYSLPFSPALWDGRIFASEPKRGDVVVFRLPKDDKTDYIKRIVGLPGDSIRVTNGILYINDQAVKREPVQDYIYRDSGRPVHAYQYYETLPGGKRHLINEQSDNERMDNTQVYIVPPGKYFAMGDNRDNSQDSRYQDEVGFVPFENLVGRAEFIFFSHNDDARWWEVWRWPSAIRFDRIFKSIN